MLEFATPWFLILLPLPFLVRWVFPAAKSDKVPEIHFPALERLTSTFSKYSSQAKHPFFFLLLISWTLLILALMQPEMVNQTRQVKNKGYDLMLAVDISASMQAVDFSTATKVINRLDATKEVVGKFVQGRAGDRIGLITFGESAYLHVPLTQDTHSVGKMLNDTVFGMAGNGTAIGDAIGLAIQTLRKRPEGSRVLVLLTDGEDNSSSLSPLEAAKLAKQYGIRIYTVAVGKKGPVPFPSNFGGYVMGEAPLDEELLKEIAAMTDGHFFQAQDKHALESIYAKIDTLEKTDAEYTEHLIRDPLFRYPLFGSVLILLMVLVRREVRVF
jgi:Ca-activated chloride channel family protein